MAGSDLCSMLSKHGAFHHMGKKVDVKVGRYVTKVDNEFFIGENGIVVPTDAVLVYYPFPISENDVELTKEVNP